jgi:Holliday junction resolvase RusA-like endonuclease
LSRCKIYVIHGDPIPLARARLSRGKFYDSQKHLKLLWGLTTSKQHGNDSLFEGPIELDVIFYMPIAKNLSLKKKALLFDQWYISRPDASNLTKFVEDAIESIVYKDDCIIVKLNVEKVYDDGKGPRTEFILKELDKKRNHRDLI